jgi:hypothetical protein
LSTAARSRELETSEDETPIVADRRQLVLSVAKPLRLRTRVAGLFLFVPLLARLGFDKLVRKAGYAGSRMIPADAALLSLLTLKLLDKERRSHIDDFNFEEALGLFAGLNILPKKSFATDYSYRAGPDQQQRLLAGWVKRLAPMLLPEANAFSLDFHPIPYRGDEAVLENHYIPGRGTAHASVQSFFAQEHESRIFCYANANLTRDEQPAAALRFVEFWHDLTGHDPEWLYFDSKLTTYAELSRLNQQGVHFITIRRRGASLVQKILARPAGDWTSAVIDIPKRRQKRVRYLEQPVRLSDYEGPARQIAVTGLGREEPTLFLTNHFEARPRDLITNYARRNRIEDGLGTNVNFFHLDCLSSEVRLNVDLDVTLTVIAHGCYRWLARQLKGFDKAKPKQLYRKFVETGGMIEVSANRTLLVTFDRRSHNPILREAALDRDCPTIPWLRGYRVKFHYR